MKYIKIGNLEISKITLGTWAIGGSMWGPYDQANAIKAIETALDNGMNIIDTAPVYGNGHAEELIAKSIQGKREKVIIATKCGLDINNNYQPNLSAKFIEEEIENSLKRLKTDYIDIYQCHWPDPKTPLAETMSILVNLQKQGKIRYIGISNFSVDDIKEALKYAKIATNQPQYSLLERTIENDGVQKICTENNIGLIPYGSLGGGMLSGKYSEPPKFKGGDARAFFYKFFQAKYWPKVKIIIDKLKALAEEKNTTPGNIALAWLMAQPGVVSPIVGAKNPQQVLENIKAAEIILTPNEVASLKNLSENLYQ